MVQLGLILTQISDFDLCAPCLESGATEQHNPSHEFFDIEIPGHVYVHTVLGGDRNRSFGNCRQVPGSDDAQVTQQGSASTPIPDDPPVRHAATCNLCDSAIVGERYVSFHVLHPDSLAKLSRQKCVICPGEGFP